MTIWTPTIENADAYLAERTSKYERRALRYRAAIEAMRDYGLDDTHTLMDVGAGWTEFDYTLRAEYGWKGRYIPIDAGIDGTDIETWAPARQVDWIVALEILEHLEEPYSAVMRMKQKANGIVFSTPNPRTTDVLAMDRTHKTEISHWHMHMLGFTVREDMFYGGRWSNGEPDSLFGYWVNGQPVAPFEPFVGTSGIEGQEAAIASIMSVGR